MPRKTLAVAVYLALVGCGHDHGNMPDAAPAADAAVPRPDAPSSHGIVQVTLIDSTKTVLTPSAGAAVVFIDAQRTQVVQTDASGQASADVIAGASVTTIQVVGSQQILDTVLATQPGDKITLGAPAIDKSAAGSFTVNFTPVPQPSNMNFTIYGPCGSVNSAISPAVLTFQRYCEPASFEILLEGFLNGAPAYADLADVPYADGGSATLPDLTAEPQFTATFSNVSSRISSVTFVRTSGGGYHNATGMVTSPSLTLSVNGPVGATATVEASFFRPGYGGSFVSRQELPTTTSIDFDPSASLLAWVGPATYDPSSRTIVVPVLADGTSNAAPDLFSADFEYGAGPGHIVEWTVFTPGPGNVAVPALPPQVGVPDPVNTPYIAVKSIDLDTVDGYDDARQNPTAVIDGTVDDVPSNGATMLRVSQSIPTT